MTNTVLEGILAGTRVRYFDFGCRVKECDEFRLGIQKATEAIQNCLKNVKKKVKVRTNSVKYIMCHFQRKKSGTF